MQEAIEPFAIRVRDLVVGFRRHVVIDHLALDVRRGEILGLVAQFYGDMGPAIYIARLHEAVSVTHFEVGILKAPFMALVIGIVACSEGLRVKGSAESLGRQTTTSVVKSIFLVIVLDGLFAVFFASIGM